MIKKVVITIISVIFAAIKNVKLIFLAYRKMFTI